MLEIILRPSAEADILAITEYSKAEYGERQTKRYVQDLFEKIAFAAEMPGIGSEMMGLPSEYCKVRSGVHRAIYRCTESELTVVRVVREREDVPDDIEDFWQFRLNFYWNVLGLYMTFFE